MADEAAAVAAPIEQAAPAVETVATETETPTAPVDDGPQLILEPGEEADAEAEAAEAAALAAAEEEFEDVDWNGKTFRGPKGLKDGILMQSAFTQKTQAVAEERKALESRRAEIDQQAAATEEELRDRAVLLGVNAQIEQYKDVDWVTLARTDPVGYNEHRARFDQLKAAAAETAESLKAKQTERTQKAERDLATRVEETLKFAREKIPGFKPELIENLVQFAQAEGIPEEAIKSNWSPALLNLLHKANIGNLTLQKQSNLPKPAPAIPLTPLAKVGGKSTPAARTDLATADMEAYVAARKAGVGGKPLR